MIPSMHVECEGNMKQPQKTSLQFVVKDENKYLQASATDQSMLFQLLKESWAVANKAPSLRIIIKLKYVATFWWSNKTM